ncbi:hypothetical protein BN12_10069 [Nostocoides japonicum T1-X7]|uniref:Secreted protein n=1 Tax=Nostocoides japonicum T1-X7 TaxID=1194083 RepID=A0A077LTU2_9MICO|nr:hypothetical protein BN12_10069 [Tetrasphaera japonica T1-X7]
MASIVTNVCRLLVRVLTVIVYSRSACAASVVRRRLDHRLRQRAHTQRPDTFGPLPCTSRAGRCCGFGHAST